MSREILIQELRKKSSDRIKKVKLEAERKLWELQALKQKELELYQASARDQMNEISDHVAAPILYKAEREALAREDAALRKLSDRLYELALDMMKGFRQQQDYEAVFARLVEEIPQQQWEKVSVNPQDLELAQAAFPGADIEADHAITGGFIAFTDGGRYTVVNTLDRRLEKGWPIILPHLLKDIIEEQNAAAAA